MHEIVAAIKVAPFTDVRLMRETIHARKQKFQNDRIEVKYSAHPPDIGVISRELARRGFTIVNSLRNSVSVQKGRRVFTISAHPQGDIMVIRKGLLAQDKSRIGAIEAALLNRKLKQLT